MSDGSGSKVSRVSGLGKSGCSTGIRVLVVGPFSAEGGLARVARMTAEGFESTEFAIERVETAKDTPENRSLLTACGSHWRRWWRLIRAIRRHRPQVVHIHTCSYGTFTRTLLDVWTCRIFGCPYILHVHGGLFAEYLGSLRGCSRRVVVAALRRASRVIVLGKSWRTNLTQLVGGLKLAIVPNAVDGRIIAEGGERGGGLLFVGDLSETKRPEDLLVAYAAIPQVLRREHPLTIVGQGSYDRRLRLHKLAACLQIDEDVTFRGCVPHCEIRDLMARADALVLPSRGEGMPLALLEAMHAGLPSIVTSVGAVPEVVEDEVEAIIVPPMDTLRLTHAIKRMLTDDSLRRRLGGAARVRAQSKHGLETFQVSIAELWREVAAIQCPRKTSPTPQLAVSSTRSLLL